MITEAERLVLLQWLIETEDEEAISEVQKIRTNSGHLTNEQDSILEARLKRFAEGKTKFSSWGEVKNRIQSNAR